MLKLCSRVVTSSYVRTMTSSSSSQENRLRSQLSPYLLQHKSNPVDWYPWGQEAIQEARSQGKMIFLSIGYSTCHWCHVMERESFEDPATAAIMNENYVNIKVDREGKIYMLFPILYCLYSGRRDQTLIRST